MFIFLLISTALAATDCATIDAKLSDFKKKNTRNQETVVNFTQQVSDRLRAEQAGILQDVQLKLEKKEKELIEKENKFLTTSIAMPVVTNSLSSMEQMANETDAVLNAAYDNNETISKDLETLMKEIQDCIKP